jgi:hypothetical protein
MQEDSPVRSVSRGREAFHSSGRGGIGNIRHSSASRDARPVDGPDDFSPTRGREPAVNLPLGGVISTGRGGAGNMRSPSRDAASPSRERLEREREILQQHAELEKTAIHSTGRGGVGNISRSRSRGPSPLVNPPIHSSGRGGLGNFAPGTGDTRIVEEEERRLHALPEAVHSSGRGGRANIIHSPDPGVEHHSPQHLGFESSGRGGAGNIKERSRSTDREGTSGDPGKLAGLWNKMTGQGKDPSAN